jgi:hypothetical protein
VKLEEEACPAAGATARMAAIAYYRVSVPWFLRSAERLDNLLDASLLALASEEEVYRGIPVTGNVGIIIQVGTGTGTGTTDRPPSLLRFYAI